MYLPLQTRQNFHHTEQIPLCCPFVVRFVPLHPLAITGLVSVLIVFPFEEYYIDSIIHCVALWGEKEMATHSSVLAWRIPGTVEPGGLPSMGSHRVGHD